MFKGMPLDHTSYTAMYKTNLFKDVRKFFRFGWADAGLPSPSGIPETKCYIFWGRKNLTIVCQDYAMTSAKCKVLTVVKIKITVVWKVTSSSLVHRYQHFGGICSLHLWG
jgi:hypothetical protein